MTFRALIQDRFIVGLLGLGVFGMVLFRVGAFPAWCVSTLRLFHNPAFPAWNASSVKTILFLTFPYGCLR